MNRARWFLVAVLAGAAGCSDNDDPNDTQGAADLVHYCETLCQRDAECFEDTDPVACDLSCNENAASVADKLRQEYLSMLDICIAGLDCETLVVQGTAPCVDEVDATLAPTVAGMNFCVALDATSGDCGELFTKAACLQISKQFDDDALKDAESCTLKSCGDIDPCIRVAFGVTEDTGPNSCVYAFDNECDEPELCAAGTDSYDCGR